LPRGEREAHDQRAQQQSRCAWLRYAAKAKAAAGGDPPRRFVRDNIRVLVDPKGRFEYLALCNMDFNAASRRALLPYGQIQ
jgi:hypothetical protein